MPDRLRSRGIDPDQEVELFLNHMARVQNQEQKPPTLEERLMEQHPQYADDIIAAQRVVLPDVAIDNNEHEGHPNTQSILQIFDNQLAVTASAEGAAPLVQVLTSLRDQAENLLRGEFRVPYRVASLVAELGKTLQASIESGSPDVLQRARVLESEFSRLHAALPLSPGRGKMQHQLGQVKARLVPPTAAKNEMAFA